ncbi:MAG: TAT-variant-translocated molybdopterin oxidoreductase [Novosphingobium sp.]|nr:TAT-variant-translocated molybdopterin oxidoreductase [Novosphingobium sp.]
MSATWKETLSQLRSQGGLRFWRGLDELAGSPEFRAALTSEFPGLASLDWNRRGVLRAFGASLALSGLAGCEASPDGRALPYIRDPEHMVPDRAQLYATGVPFAGILQPVLGVTNAGRPTKLEGNPDHPASRGATDAFTQAALLDLYDPERSQVPRAQGRPMSWAELDTAMAGRAALLDATRGDGLRLLTGATTSPTLLRQIEALTTRWPGARWHVFEPVDDSGMHAATQQAFGRALEVTPLLDQAQAVVAFDADPLGAGPRQVRDSVAWSARRRAFQGGDGGSVMMVVEPTPTLTGGRSLDRLVAPASRIPLLVTGHSRGCSASFPPRRRCAQTSSAGSNAQPSALRPRRAMAWSWSAASSRRRPKRSAGRSTSGSATSASPPNYQSPCARLRRPTARSTRCSPKWTPARSARS